jgi:hypothetical protein
MRKYPYVKYTYIYVYIHTYIHTHTHTHTHTHSHRGIVSRFSARLKKLLSSLKRSYRLWSLYVYDIAHAVKKYIPIFVVLYLVTGREAGKGV